MRKLFVLLLAATAFSCGGNSEIKQAFDKTGFELEVSLIEKSATFLNGYSDPYLAFYPKSTPIQEAIDDNFATGVKNLDKVCKAVDKIDGTSTETEELVNAALSLKWDYDNCIGDKIEAYKAYGKVWGDDLLYDKTEFELSAVSDLRVALITYHSAMMANYINMVEQSEKPADKAKFRQECVDYVSKRVGQVVSNKETASEIIEQMNIALYDNYNLDPNAAPQYNGD